MFQSPRKVGRASLLRSLLLIFAIFTNMDTTYSVKVHKLFICFTNNGVYSLHMCFLKIIASCIVPFNRLDAGLVWQEIMICIICIVLCIYVLLILFLLHFASC